MKINSKNGVEIINPRNIIMVFPVKEELSKKYRFEIVFIDGSTRYFQFETLEQAQQEFDTIELLIDRQNA